MRSYDPDGLSAVLEEAASLPLDARRAYLEKASHGDDDLRETLDSLLAAHDAAAGYFERITEQIVAPALAAIAADGSDETRDIEHTIRPALGRRLKPTEIRRPFSSGETTAQLLRRRLLTLSVVFGVITGLGTIVFLWSLVLPALRAGIPVRPAVWVGLTLYALLLTTAAIYALVLRSSRSLSLRTLRTLEVAGF